MTPQKLTLALVLLLIATGLTALCFRPIDGLWWELAVLVIGLGVVVVVMWRAWFRGKE